MDMKVAVPTENSQGMESALAEHFGRCSHYILLDENGTIVKTIRNTSRHMGGQGLPPELIRKHGAEALLCKGIGPRAIELFGSYGIDVFVCQGNKVGEAFDFWRSGKARKAGISDACEEHRK